MTATLDKAPIPVRKRAVSSFEQVELWPGRAPSAVETMEALPEATPVIETVVQTACTSAHVEEVVETPARKPRGLSRKFVAASPVERMPAVQPARNIARFLKVNGAIDGVRSSTVRFDLPSRGLSQMLRLWRGSSETTEYIPVC